MRMQKRKEKGLKVSDFALILVVFSDIMAVKGLGVLLLLRLFLLITFFIFSPPPPPPPPSS